MGIGEYAVVNDFFQCGIEGDGFDFPCCVCRNNNLAGHEYPCKYCGHNANAEQCYTCSLCGELQKGNAHKDSKTIASGTPAQISYVCLTCYNTIMAERSSS